MTGAWTFDDPALVASFDAHVREQLPWYELATRLVTHVAAHYVRPHGLVYDVGASTGNISRALAPVCQQRHARLVAIEVSPEMCSTFPALPGVELVQADAAHYPFVPYDVAVCFLVLMFVDIAARRAVLGRLATQLRAGGALILVERWLRPLPPYLALCSRRWTLAEKLLAGAEPGAILAKERALAGVQRPVDEALLGTVGLPGAELFRCGEFAAHVFERPE